MSDIKYIIVSDVQEELGEQQQRCCTRRPFPCLAVTRYAAAGVVAVLAVTVISMVIRAMLRSEDIRLFVNNGYIGADSLWISESTAQVVAATNPKVGAGPINHAKITTIEAAAQQLGSVSKSDAPEDDPVSTQIGGAGGHEAAVEEPDMNTRTKFGGCYLGCSGGSGSSTTFYNPPPAPPVSNVTLRPPTMTNLRVILVVNNPGGRSRIDCNGTTVTVVDRANPRQEIARLELSNFTVPQQTIITLQKRVRISDTAVLRYIWDRYGRRPTFGVMVEVSSSVVSYPLGKMTEPKRQTYRCRSVTLGLVEDEASFANQVDCTAAENDKEPKTAPPAAAPTHAPAPAPAH